eukprot:TRINITY_DN3728_c0_g1_i2.p1 TRINITY_DN3728_c0_g1~~TRINITY_DN3728_c0_g1_i2.p1  ORF type:complete len:155 (+),score=18.93 TRINITY_DN3728_c0_g1_i2:67-531(+)
MYGPEEVLGSSSESDDWLSSGDEDDLNDDVANLFVDCHCHLHDDTRNLHLTSRLPFYGLCLMGTQESDWNAVEKLFNEVKITSQKNKNHLQNLYPSFGIHPWYAHKVKSKDSDYDLDNDIKSPELQAIIMMHSYEVCELVDFKSEVIFIDLLTD